MGEKTALTALLADLAHYKHSPKGLPEEPGHSGDVLQHSIWTALQCAQWASPVCESTRNQQSPLFEPGMNMPRLIAAALLHDIGKAGDCITDVYALHKYAALGHRNHPRFSGSIIMGWIPYRLCGARHRESARILDFHDVLKELSVLQWKQEIAVIAFMHWELGDIDMKIQRGIPAKVALQEYMDLFIRYSQLVGVQPTLTVLKECILVSAADISASQFPRVAFGTEKTGICQTCRVDVVEWLCEYIAGHPGSVQPRYATSDAFRHYGMPNKLPAMREALVQTAKKNQITD